jgi:hypothetical protein
MAVSVNGPGIYTLVGTLPSGAVLDRTRVIRRRACSLGSNAVHSGLHTGEDATTQVSTGELRPDRP